MVALCESQTGSVHCVIAWSLDHGQWLASCLRTDRRAPIVHAMDDMVRSVGTMVRIPREVPERM